MERVVTAGKVFQALMMQAFSVKLRSLPKIAVYNEDYVPAEYLNTPLSSGPWQNGIKALSKLCDIWEKFEEKTRRYKVKRNVHIRRNLKIKARSRDCSNAAALAWPSYENGEVGSLASDRFQEDRKTKENLGEQYLGNRGWEQWGEGKRWAQDRDEALQAFNTAILVKQE